MKICMEKNESLKKKILCTPPPPPSPVTYIMNAALMPSAAGDFVYEKFSEINIKIRPSCYFYRQVSSSVMILLAFLSCFLVFFFVKDQIDSFH